MVAIQADAYAPDWCMSLFRRPLIHATPSSASAGDAGAVTCVNVYYVNLLAQVVAALFVASTWSSCCDDGGMFLRLPKRLPSIEEMLLQLGRPSPEVVAKALHVSPTTVRRWIKSGRTPRAAALAIYWLTHEGRGDIEIDMHNELIRQYGLARSRADEIKRLEHLVQHLMVIGQFGAANEPSVRIGGQRV